MSSTEPVQAVVNIPRRRRRTSPVNAHTVPDTANSDSQLISDKLYVHLPPNISKEDIFMALQHCNPVDIQLSHHTDHISGHVQFATADQAERVYVLYKGIKLKNGESLHLRSQFDEQEEIVESSKDDRILQVSGLPLDSSLDHLYDLFRPFGPLRMCKINPTHRNAQTKTASVQFLRSEDSEKAEAAMHKALIRKNIIHVVPYVASQSNRTHVSGRQSTIVKSNNQTRRRGKPHPSLQSDPQTMVDYSNLYIRNLDLRLRSSHLFNAFRSFGHIVSACVMRDRRTKDSRGFGFVSFSTANEACYAMQKMNGTCLMSRRISIAFHEPKKRERRTSVMVEPTAPKFNDPPSTFAVSFNPPPPTSFPADALYYPVLFTSDSNAALSLTAFQPNAFIPSSMPPLMPSVDATGQPSVNPFQSFSWMNVSNTIQPDCGVVVPTYEYPVSFPQEPTEYPWNMYGTEASQSPFLADIMLYVRRQRLFNAVAQLTEFEPSIDTIDMLLTLGIAEQSLCFFNPTFLKTKVQLAQMSVEAFQKKR
ncbi:uncharacterized protein BYT42DRAFT_613585 [Radiomyces spectabilis]|uniref:uncharacterized protein n=1 Tax=Radiomyces spectabilis TaxID=64574 RepID=UPI00221EDBB0|nr:uncharacterized protein BYT42DRAFT_613585 [Radiomyces spectabilis]KAI8379255.1 hypothetical protein BYT42DRAFT_613585 [Radiomyces spectabilis]